MLYKIRIVREIEKALGFPKVKYESTLKSKNMRIENVVISKNNSIIIRTINTLYSFDLISDCFIDLIFDNIRYTLVFKIETFLYI